MNIEGQAHQAALAEAQERLATEKTPEQLEEEALLLALQREDKGCGSYISLADDRAVLARAVRKARPELKPMRPAVK